MWVTAIIVVLNTAACATREEIAERHYQQLSERFDKWIGKHRDQRIKVAGPPGRCFILESKEEVCEWVKSGVSGEGHSAYDGNIGYGGGYSEVSSWEHRVLFIYDTDHIATSWRYSGDWGQFESGRKPGGVSSVQ
jgi:hypothetical protein